MVHFCRFQICPGLNDPFRPFPNPFWNQQKPRPHGCSRGWDYCRLLLLGECVGLTVPVEGHLRAVDGECCATAVFSGGQALQLLDAASAVGVGVLASHRLLVGAHHGVDEGSLAGVEVEDHINEGGFAVLSGGVAPVGADVRVVGRRAAAIVAAVVFCVVGAAIVFSASDCRAQGQSHQGGQCECEYPFHGALILLFVENLNCRIAHTASKDETHAFVDFEGHVV